MMATTQRLFFLRWEDILRGFFDFLTTVPRFSLWLRHNGKENFLHKYRGGFRPHGKCPRLQFALVSLLAITRLLQQVYRFIAWSVAGPVHRKKPFWEGWRDSGCPNHNECRGGAGDPRRRAWVKMYRKGSYSPISSGVIVPVFIRPGVPFAWGLSCPAPPHFRRAVIYCLRRPRGRCPLDSRPL